MALTPGTRLGPYEITGQIGKGGTGEVYRALDTNLGRQVAIKILPDAFAADPERLARFEREALLLASLNHPNIAAIYGFEESNGVRALVLELVEGPTLADRISRGPIPLDEALPIARQIAEALEAAHEQGIIHRDLNPACIKIKDDGTVKVLDFGLAKLTQAQGRGPEATDLTASPTIASPATMTGSGVILGTAAYMSPEQAKGEPANKGSDIWAFGCVLYEMLAGKRAFGGEDVTETLAAVLLREPDWNLLAGDVPPAIRTLLRRCLEKDREKRMAELATVLFLIDEAPSLTASAAVGTRQMARSMRRQVTLVGLIVVVLILIVGTLIVERVSEAPPSTGLPPPLVFAPAPPPPSALPSLDFAAIDRALESLPLGSIAFNVPAVMTLNRSESLFLLLSPSASVEDLEKQLQEQLTREAKVEGVKIRIAPQMDARLSGTNFAIISLSPEIQPVAWKQPTRWQWEVRPTEAGIQTLHLTLTALLQINGVDSKRAIRTFDREIEVQVTWPQWVLGFVAENWQWLWAFGAVPMLGWWWARKRNRRRKIGF